MTVEYRTRSDLSEIMEFYAPRISAKGAIPIIFKRLSLHYQRFTLRRIRALFNMEARAIRAEEVAAIDRELAHISEQQIIKGTLKHADRLEAYAARLSLLDRDRNHNVIAHYRGLAQRMRRAASGEEA